MRRRKKKTRRQTYKKKNKGGEKEREPTELDNDLAKIIRMPRPSPRALVTHGILVHPLPEDELFHIAHALQDKAQREQDHAHDVAARAEPDKRERGHVGRVEDRHGQRDGPDPDHLKHPEAEKGEELVALVVEAVVLAGLEDAEEQEPGQAEAPEHDEEGGDDLPGVRVRAGHGEGDDGEDDEVGAARKVWMTGVLLVLLAKFPLILMGRDILGGGAYLGEKVPTSQLVEFEGECYCEEKELVRDGDEQGDGEVVAIQDMDGSLHDGRAVCLCKAFELQLSR